MKLHSVIIFYCIVVICSSLIVVAADDEEVRGRSLRQRTQPKQISIGESRIIGGTTASPGEYPFYTKWAGCGASLVAPDVLLTAAHCQGISSTTVYVGQSRSFGSDIGIQRRIVRKVPHPFYRSGGVNYDYMLMKLNAPVTTIDPIPLNTNDNIPSSGESLTVVGFGETTNGGLPSSLQEVNVNYIPTNQCNGFSGYNGGVNDATMFCAGVGGGKDSCQGDSGGPIFRKNTDGTFTQMGIVSWGIGCAEARYPGVYSRISGQIDWIQAGICELSPSSCTSQGGPGNGPGKVAIRLDITYDAYVRETGWSFQQNGQTVVEQRQGAINESGNTIYQIRLSPGATTFRITDAYADGICCNFGNGRYTIYGPDNQVLASSNGQYGSGEVKGFTVPGEGGDNPTTTGVPATRAPTRAPTLAPTRAPTREPTLRPTSGGTTTATRAPTRAPTGQPTGSQGTSPPTEGSTNWWCEFLPFLC
eukprot:CAMPEP_0178917076 /NCGR_PEP_ID=MMETSP0786-20121207/13036_1 /TAXON_ID=186022 /ORGANISM="Thalassionema frauenfeldii, Strain CCMP 1798" /LENGTH=473 /DNA_ID=CAMNT_0020590567 /DNA_START=21 /DNA_END=1442 /DNA_ORIENTATION=-